MPVYTPPALNAVDFALTVQPAHSVDPYLMPLSVYTVPALNAVDFALVSYTQPVYNTIDFEFITSGSAAAVDTFTGLLVLSGNAPSVVVSDNKAAFTDVGVLSLVGFSPTVSITQNVTVSPGTGELILSAFVPGVFGDSLRGTFGGKRHPVRYKRSFGWTRR